MIRTLQFQEEVSRRGQRIFIKAISCLGGADDSVTFNTTINGTKKKQIKLKSIFGIRGIEDWASVDRIERN